MFLHLCKVHYICWLLVSKPWSGEVKVVERLAGRKRPALLPNTVNNSRA